jgi:uncharacterized membrane protein YecN with MAPEG domain
MHALPITAVAAAILGLIYLVLTVQVIRARGTTKASLGDGSGGLIAAGQEHTAPLLVASRSHANFAEYVPLCLILIGLTELNGTRTWVVQLLAALLVIGRVIHPLGMGRKIPNPFRAGGLVLTVLVLVGASAAILIHAIRVG